MKMSSYLTCLALWLVPAASLLAEDTPTKKKPNVIYIMADELGYYEPAFMGGTTIQTPNWIAWRRRACCSRICSLVRRSAPQPVARCSRASIAATLQFARMAAARLCGRMKSLLPPF